MSIKTSKKKLIKVKERFKKQGIRLDSSIIAEKASVSVMTLRRFWGCKDRIRDDNFINICKAIGEDWENLAEEVIDSHEDILDRSLMPFSTFDDGFVGREVLVRNLCDRLQHFRVIALLGLTGIGKTALAERLVQETCQTWEKVVRINLESELEDFLSIAAQLLEQIDVSISLDESKDRANLLTDWILRSLAEHRYLIIFDALENILVGNSDEGWSIFKDDNWEKFFSRIFNMPIFASCVLLTSQDLPEQIATVGERHKNLWYCEVVQGLDKTESLNLFEAVGFDINPRMLETQYLERMISVYEGHPLALRTIAGEISNPIFAGNILSYWEECKDEIERFERIIQESKTQPISKDDQLSIAYMTNGLRRRVKSRINRSFDRLKREVPLAYILLCLASQYRCAVPSKLWLNHFDDLEDNCPERRRRQIIDILCDRYLVEPETKDNQLHLRLHHLIRSIAIERFNKEFSEGNNGIVPFD